ncbi:MAG TPA: hypothetical protein PKK96_15525 [Anaerolineales bacterium]|jgi:cell division protein FtsB|nr:hypothetical protein [Anaerolineales bacterium]MCC6568254.1 hypothetical protein [Anaerolineales bacterium]HMS00417.1 hypothetical protein [Anaerolineales bacterium]HNQ93388.1 hypothetical protein [Anaerolineales bacterium]HNS62410.1 hypothetical protein [Anaerolineales bacterium]
MPALPFNARRVATIIGVIALVFIVLEFNRRLEEMNLLNKQYELVQQQATQAVQTQTALQTQVAFAASDGAVDEWARTDGHYVQEGDLPIVPIGQPGAAPIELNTPAPTPTQMTNVQTWWDLFFGEH